MSMGLPKKLPVVLYLGLKVFLRSIYWQEKNYGEVGTLSVYFLIIKRSAVKLNLKEKTFLVPSSKIGLKLLN